MSSTFRVSPVTTPTRSSGQAVLIGRVRGLAATAAGTFHALGQQGEKNDTIKTQTNGTLSKLTEDLQAKNTEIAELRE